MHLHSEEWGTGPRITTVERDHGDVIVSTVNGGRKRFRRFEEVVVRREYRYLLGDSLAALAEAGGLRKEG